MTEVYIIAALTILAITLTFATVSLGDAGRAQLMLGMAGAGPIALYLTWLLLETSAPLTIAILGLVVAGVFIYIGERGRPALGWPRGMRPMVSESIGGMLAFGGMLSVAGGYYPTTLGIFLLVSACAFAAAALAGLEVPPGQPGHELARRALLAATWMLFAAVFVLLGMWTLAAVVMMTGGMVVVVAVRPLRQAILEG